jgi:hypothetical protein
LTVSFGFVVVVCEVVVLCADVMAWDELVADLALAFGAGVEAADETAMVANAVKNKDAMIEVTNFTRDTHSFQMVR